MTDSTCTLLSNNHAAGDPSPTLLHAAKLPLYSDEMLLHDTPLQLVRIIQQGSAWTLEVNEEAAQILECCGEQRVSVCTMCGPSRTGKSYILNLLHHVGRRDNGIAQFQVGASTTTCTEGIWMWGVKAIKNKSGDDSVLLFIDCEGFGNHQSDTTKDAKLMSLCLLLSSIFVLNTKGVLNEQLLSKLSLVCHIAKILEQGQDNDGPTLLWLLRDSYLELVDESGNEISADQYLERTLFHPAPRTQGVREVTECLTNFFPRRHCATLMQPVFDEDHLAQLADIPYENLRPEFCHAFEAMREQLLDLALAYPKSIAGQVVGAASLVKVLKRTVGALNRDQSLSVINVWHEVEQEALETLAAELHEKFRNEVCKLENGNALPVTNGKPLPVNSELLLTFLHSTEGKLHKEWQRRTMGKRSLCDEHWHLLRKRFEEDWKRLTEFNNKLAEKEFSDKMEAMQNDLQQKEAELHDANAYIDELMEELKQYEDWDYGDDWEGWQEDITQVNTWKPSCRFFGSSWIRCLRPSH